MDRRTYLKSILAVSTLGITSFSVAKWFSINKPIDVKKIVDNEEVLADLVDIIIPETDTPGAKAASVHLYIMNVITNCTRVKQQNRFLSGLEELKIYAADQYGKSFLHCTTIEKQAILQHIADHSGYDNPLLNKINSKLLGEPFYFSLRQLTVEGYCLSKLGATKGLAYDYLPVNYEACIPLKPNQKSWATK